MPEVPPFLWSDAGDFDSPKEYTVPGAGEVQPYTATATYVNASGQAILPALRIKSAEGALLSLTFPVGSTIANGASSEVTFVPPFGSAQGSSPAPPTTTGLPWAFMQRTSVLVPNFVATQTAVDFDLALGSVSGFTSDAAIFTVGAALGGGIHGISILAEGQYLWAATAFASKAAPAAGVTSAIRTGWDTGDCWNGQYVSPFVTGPGAAVAQTQPSLMEQFNVVAGGAAPPQATTVFLSQNTGGNLTFTQPTFAVFQLSTIGTLDFT